MLHASCYKFHDLRRNPLENLCLDEFSIPSIFQSRKLANCLRRFFIASTLVINRLEGKTTARRVVDVEFDAGFVVRDVN